MFIRKIRTVFLQTLFLSHILRQRFNSQGLNSGEFKRNTGKGLRMGLFTLRGNGSFLHRDSFF